MIRLYMTVCEPLISHIITRIFSFNDEKTEWDEVCPWICSGLGIIGHEIWMLQFYFIFFI